jgi:hypothetical protein
MTITAADIIAVTNAVTKEWTRQRKAEERHNRSRHSREHLYSGRVGFTDVADDILPAGYAHASGNGQYTVDKRQFYYAVRDEFQERTGREITASYFSQALLVKYMNQNPEKTASWKITASPRGTLTIPNTGFDTRIPCGTIAIDEHLRHAAETCNPFADTQGTSIGQEWPSLAEGQRFQGVLYIEKEGFDPQLREAKIAERFDLAVISCKGQSVVAARAYVDHICRTLGGVPLVIAHDFDKAGFEISQCLTNVSDWARANDLVKYEFKNDINVTDLGLRLSDVEEYELKSERCQFHGDFASRSIATATEQAFLRTNRRVELNAFTAPDFIRWLTARLGTRFPERLIPEDNILAGAYLRALCVARLNQTIETTRQEAIDEASTAEIPEGLRQQIREQMAASGEAWDKAVYRLAETKVSRDDKD